MEILMPKIKLCQLVILTIVAGCTTQPHKDHGADSANASGTECHSEHVTGSMLDKTVCTTKAQRDAQRDAAYDLEKAAAAQGGGCRSNSGTACQ